jgi:hypothetical protein
MKNALDPVDRVSEVRFGLIMVLTFTGPLSVADAVREDIRTMLVGALGCNLAWASSTRSPISWAAWPRRATAS